MFGNFQKTIQSSIQIKGVGLHNGVKVNLNLKPGEANTGILFKRTDVDELYNYCQVANSEITAART